MSGASKTDQKAALDIASWLFNVVTSVGIILVNKALMATYGFSFGESFEKISQAGLTCFHTLNKLFSNYEHSYNINRFAFRNNHIAHNFLDVAWLHPAFSASMARSFEIRFVRKLLNRWYERQPHVELRRILPGRCEYSVNLFPSKILKRDFCFWNCR